jgi:hypothetical protein
VSAPDFSDELDALGVARTPALVEAVDLLQEALRAAGVTGISAITALRVVESAIRYADKVPDEKHAALVAVMRRMHAAVPAAMRAGRQPDDRS